LTNQQAKQYENANFDTPRKESLFDFPPSPLFLVNCAFFQGQFCSWVWKGFNLPDLQDALNGGDCVEKKCPVCKKAYTTFDAKKKYCSDACAKQANKKK
jgi:hypothetical protein